jgi:hypothetical protein
MAPCVSARSVDDCSEPVIQQALVVGHETEPSPSHCGFGGENGCSTDQVVPPSSVPHVGRRSNRSGEVSPRGDLKGRSPLLDSDQHLPQ